MRKRQKKRMIIIGVLAVTLGGLIAWIGGFDVIEGVGIGLVAFVGYAVKFELPSAAAEAKEQVDARYRLLTDEPPYLVPQTRGLRGQNNSSRRVIALYPDRFIVTNVRAKADVPDEIYMPRGAGALAAMPCYGTPVAWARDEIDSVDIHVGRTFEREYTFALRGPSAVFRFKLPSADGERFAAGLEHVLGNRIRRSADAPASIHRKRIRAMLGYCLLVDAIAVVMVWAAGASGADSGGWELLAHVRDRLGPRKATFLLAFLLLFCNMLMMLIASLDPGHGGPDSEA